MISMSKLVAEGGNLSYILSEDEKFSSTAYKMMQGMLETGFLACTAYRYNGAIKLMYLTEGKKPLSQLEGLSEGEVLDVVSSIIDTALQIATAGFLTPENIVLSPNTVFAETETGNCYFVYIPTDRTNSGMNRNVLEKKIIDLLNGFLVRWASLQSLHRLVLEASREGANLTSIRQVSEQLRAGQHKSRGYYPGADASMPVLHLVGVNTPGPMDIVISKPEFIIGSSVNGVDGTVSFSRAISRVHCKLYVVGTDIYIEDMGSTNGTYVNNKRIAEGHKVPVNIGDKIKLARNNEFVIRRD